MRGSTQLLKVEGLYLAMPRKMIEKPSETDPVEMPYDSAAPSPSVRESLMALCRITTTEQKIMMSTRESTPSPSVETRPAAPGAIGNPPARFPPLPYVGAVTIGGSSAGANSAASLAIVGTIAATGGDAISGLLSPSGHVQEVSPVSSLK